jgi:hypothetical protein
MGIESRVDKMNNKEKKRTKTRSAKSNPIDKLAGIIKIKADVSKYFIKKENGYPYVSGTCP